jgi:sec-independent protein translocase protein TatC
MTGEQGIFAATRRTGDEAGTFMQEHLDKQTLTEHLRELRSCLLVSLAAVAAGFALAYAYIRPISDWLFRPLVRVLPGNTTLIFTSYQEGFFFI